MIIFTINDIISLGIGAIIILILLTIPLLLLIGYIVFKVFTVIIAALSGAGNKLQQRVWRSRAREDDEEGEYNEQTRN